MDDRTSHRRVEALEEALGAARAETEACRNQFRQVARDLGERIKELSCLYGVSSALQPSERLSDVMQSVLSSLIAAYQFPEITSACIHLEGQTFCSEGLRRTRWCQAADILTDHQSVGSVEIFYAEERPEAAEGPFLIEERHLIDAVAGLLARYTQRKEVDEALRESERKYRTLVDNLYEGIWLIDQEANTTFVNTRMAELLGYTVEEMLGRDIYRFMGAHAIDNARGHLARATTGARAEYDFEFLRKRGEPIYTHVVTTPLFDDKGQYQGMLAGITDITERKRAEEALDRRKQEFEALVERSPDIIARVDDTGCLRYINPAIEQVTGLPQAFFIGKNIADVGLASEELALRKQTLRQVFRTGREHVIEHRHVRPDSERYFQARLAPEFGRDGKVESVLIVERDITELKNAQFALEDLTLHDPLTGLANRRYLERFVEREWRREARHHHHVALIMADIDHFKAYNDQYGHQRGDICLQEVAQVLTAHVHRPTDLVVRFGGEEFLVILLETEITAATRLAEAMLHEVASRALRHEASPTAPVITVSLGVAAAPAQLSTFDTLLEKADQALYQAKLAGRNRVETHMV